VNSLDVEQQRAAEEGLSEEELVIFDLVKKETLTKAERERVKVASQRLLESLTQLIKPLQHWTERETSQAKVETFILDRLYEVLPTPPFTEEEKEVVAKQVYQHIWQQSTNGSFPVVVAT